MTFRARSSRRSCTRPYNVQSFLIAMPTFCDVALPVPLDMAFTYKIAEQQPVVGGRVLVPFRNQRISGVVTALHDRAPSMQAKTVIQVLDTEPVLDEGLMKLGQWIAQYYLAPIGDVFRSMLPLAAEIKKAKLYRITEVGYEALHASATAGSSRRSKQDIDTQMIEYAVLDYLSMSERGAGRDDPFGYGREPAGAGSVAAQEMDCARRRFFRPRRAAHGAGGGAQRAFLANQAAS